MTESKNVGWCRITHVSIEVGTLPKICERTKDHGPHYIDTARTMWCAGAKKGKESVAYKVPQFSHDMANGKIFTAEALLKQIVSIVPTTALLAKEASAAMTTDRLASVQPHLVTKEIGAVLAALSDQALASSQPEAVMQKTSPGSSFAHGTFAVVRLSVEKPPALGFKNLKLPDMILKGVIG